MNAFEEVDKYFDSLKEKYAESEDKWLKIACDLKSKLGSAIWQLEYHSKSMTIFLDERCV